MNMSLDERVTAGLNGLVQIERLLVAQNERNWIRGIRAAIAELRNEDGSINIDGLSKARSIYRTMMLGGRGFAEYYIWGNDEDARLAANSELDKLRERLWSLFDSEE